MLVPARGGALIKKLTKAAQTLDLSHSPIAGCQLFTPLGCIPRAYQGQTSHRLSHNTAGFAPLKATTVFTKVAFPLFPSGFWQGMFICQITVSWLLNHLFKPALKLPIGKLRQDRVPIPPNCFPLYVNAGVVADPHGLSCFHWANCPHNC